ncbi:hypothetical protein GCM10020295_72220 [Streptomyces cinereospinus]
MESVKGSGPWSSTGWSRSSGPACAPSPAWAPQPAASRATERAQAVVKAPMGMRTSFSRLVLGQVAVSPLIVCLTLSGHANGEHDHAQ